jgi:hypothetical protein
MELLLIIINRSCAHPSWREREGAAGGVVSAALVLSWSTVNFRQERVNTCSSVTMMNLQPYVDIHDKDFEASRQMMPTAI